MKLSKRTNTIILWIISIGLLVSMLIAFTPTLGNLFGNRAQQNGQPQLIVNGQTIGEVEVEQARRNPPYNISVEGEAGQDLELLFTESLIDQALISQAADKMRVSNAEVNQAVRDFREAQGVSGSSNDQRYLALIGQYGFSDASFRDYYRQQLKVQRYQESLTENVTVSDDEVAAFYEANRDAYQSEPRITAREIVVDDEATANALYQRAQNGEAFAALAQEASLERADRAGALGAPEGSTEPQPVTRAALPTAVADAAFAFRGPGLTEPIEASGRYYLIQVESYQPAGVRPLEEVRDQVEADALDTKRAGVVEAAFDELRQNAQVELPPESSLTLDDPAVARVGDTEITNSELARALYLNPQIQQSLNSSTIDLITGLFKPTVLEQLIDRELAYQGAQELDATFFGSKSQVAQQALAYVSRDAAASDEELRQYYDANLESYTVPASAVTTRVDFDSQEAASAFRQALLDGEALQAAADASGGAVQELGTVNPGALQSELDTALFATDAFEALPSGEEVSDVLVLSEEVPAEPEATSDATGDAAAQAESAAAETAAAETAGDAAATTDTTNASPDTASDAADNAATTDTIDAAATDTTATDATDTPAEPATTTRETYVVLVATRTPERVRSFEEVRAQVEGAVLQSKRSELQSAWLDGLRERITVENLLAQASAAPAAPDAGADVSAEGASDTPATEDPTAAAATEQAPTDGAATDEATPSEDTAPVAPADGN